MRYTISRDTPKPAPYQIGVVYKANGEVVPDDGPSRCPSCRRWADLFVRSHGMLVCRDCGERA